MEVAALISIILQDYADFGLIIALLLFNSSIAFWEEHTSANAIAALKAQLTPTCKCLRDGELKKVNSDELVPGDVVFLRLGDIVPADSIILDGEGLKIDQASLTGESLPVNKGLGEEIFSGSVVKQGEAMAMVYATGANTFFGKAATLVGSTENAVCC
jgi:H+-transporting ATPase